LDSSDLKIDDIVLEKDSLKLSKYDFNTEVDVNILGHIFEHSLNEIEEITAELQGEKLDKKKSKRKKDGVFYTPKYITKYIVENTVGTLCNEKKVELQINNLLIDENYRKKDRKINEKGKKLFKTLNDYKDWLLTLKILDPACGSGAFLNQTLDFLIAEHKQADDLIAELTGESLRIFDTDKSILENNIYGVDINEESVEIAKLSLWLRTAQRGRPLSDLSGNIKCGNSLIDDTEVAGDKAFDWHKEFPHVFNPEIKEKVYQKLPETKPDYLKLIKEKTKEAQKKAQKSAELSKEAIEISQKVYEYAEKIENVSEPKTEYGINKGGFDVVLGNPPYGASIQKKDKDYIYRTYTTVEYQIDTYTVFIEKGNDLLKSNGLLGFIVPSTWLTMFYFKELRSYLINKTELKNVFLLRYQVFSDVTAETSILICKKRLFSGKNLIETNFFDVNNEIENKPPSIIKQNIWSKNTETGFNIFFNNAKSKLISKINSLSYKLSEIANSTVGIKPYQTNKGKPKQTKEDGKNRIFDATYKIDEEYKQYIVGRNFNKYKLFPDKTKWIKYGEFLAEPRQSLNFFQKKIVVRQTSDKIIATLDEVGFLTLNNVHNVVIRSNKISFKYVLILLNSTLLQFYYLFLVPEKGRTFAEVKAINLLKLPIKKIPQEAQQAYIKKADLMLSLNKELQKEKNNFLNTIKEEKGIKNITKKLDTFYDFEYEVLKKELAKQKVKFALGNENNEWREYFNTAKQKINDLQNKINQTDKEIDKMVYELYELTNEEIEIVGNSVK